MHSDMLMTETSDFATLIWETRETRETGKPGKPGNRETPGNPGNPGNRETGKPGDRRNVFCYRVPWLDWQGPERPRGAGGRACPGMVR